MPVLRAGAQLKHGTFVVHSILGRGGFGEVYLARQPRMDRDVAIKVLSSGLSEEGDVVRRFEREALAAGMLLHPNVLPVFDFDFDDDAGVWFLAMQYIPGGITLQNLMKGPMPPREVVRIVTSVASALDAAHARGIVHRDVKPPNVLIDEHQRPLLTDFGIAHLQSLTGMTQKGMAIGTPAYVSPEQGMGKMVGPASDQYSLAVMTYQMLAGRPPFTGDSLSLVMQHVSTMPPALTTLNPSLQTEVAAVVARALSKNPDDRYASCGEFGAALATAVADVSPSGAQPMVPSGAQPIPGPTIATPPDYLAGPSQVPPPPPGSAVSLQRVQAGSPGRTVVSEAVEASAGPNEAASGAMSSGAAAAARARPVPSKLPIPLIAGGVGVVLLLAVGGIAVRQMTGTQGETSPTPTVLTAVVIAPTAAVIAPTVPPDSNRGVVTIDSVPPAVVVVDDEPGSRTPRELRLEAGDHDIKLVAATYEEWTRRVNVVPGQKIEIPRVGLVPLPDSEIVANSVTDTRVGRDPYVDAGDIIRLAVPTDSFRVNEDINFLVYLNPKTYAIRDLSLNLKWQIDRAGGLPPAVLTATQQVDKGWEQTFVRACAPAAAVDATGTNTPLNATLFIDDRAIGTMTFRVTPGPATGQSDCDKTVLPRSGVGT